MSYFKDITTLALLVTLFTGCESNIDYEGDPIENFIVLNSLVMADSSFECRISRSNTILESNMIHGISDASVKLYEDGVFMTNLSGDEEGNYHSGSEFKARATHEYTITVDHPKYKNVSATTIIPEKPQVKMKSIKEFIKDGYSRGLSCELELTDYTGDDYYRLKVYLPSVIYNYEDNTHKIVEPYEYRFTYISSKDPVLNNNTVASNDDSYSDRPPNEYQIFNDHLFNGEKCNLTFNFPCYEVFTEKETDMIYANKYLSAIKFEVQKISKDVHQYFTTIEACKYYQDSPFSEPIKVHSNVTGGAGIFGGVRSNIIHYEP